MAVLKSSTAAFRKDVLEKKGLVFVDFYAEWCGPCKLTSPIIHELSDEIKNMSFIEIDVDQNQDLAGQYSVFSIPTFMIFKDGKVISQFVGAMGKEGFLGEINKAQAAS